MATRRPLVLAGGYVKELPEGDNSWVGLDWGFLVANWSSAPTQVGTATVNGQTGTVYAYTFAEVTRFRFVPTNYAPALDGFYSAFESSTLSSLIVSRG